MQRLGTGYAHDHPTLIGAFMQVAADDFRTAIWAKGLDDLAEVLAELNLSRVP